MIDAALFKTLQAQGQAASQPALSVYFPFDPSQGDPTQGDRRQRGQRVPATRLRALVARAEQALAAFDIDQEQSGELLGALDEIAGGLDVAHHDEPGFGFFATRHWSRMVTLPVSIPEAVVVGRNFHVKPLLPLLSRNRRFTVLALSAGDARLYAATPHAWDELALDILPDTAGTGRATARRRGAGRTADYIPEDPRDALLVADIGRVAHAVRHALAEDTAPLLLAAESHMVGHFRRLARLPQLREQALMLNPFAFAPDVLHARTTELMRPVLDEAPEAVLEQVRARLGSAGPTVGIRFEEILARAREGRVEAIVVAEDRALWGSAGDPPVAHGHQVGAEPDLLNEAAVEVLRHSGRAYALPAERLPRNALAVATYRF